MARQVKEVSGYLGFQTTPLRADDSARWKRIGAAAWRGPRAAARPKPELPSRRLTRCAAAALLIATAASRWNAKEPDTLANRAEGAAPGLRRERTSHLRWTGDTREGPDALAELKGVGVAPADGFEVDAATSRGRFGTDFGGIVLRVVGRSAGRPSRCRASFPQSAGISPSLQAHVASCASRRRRSRCGFRT